MAAVRPSRAAVLLTCALAAAGAARARTPLVDDPPWHLLDDGRSVSLTASRSADDVSDWTASRTGLTASLPGGGEARPYVRWAFVAVDRASLPPAERWPEIVGPDAEQADLDDWIADRNAAGWDRPEVGILGRGAWPLLGVMDYALSAWLPFADNGLYPLAVRGISLRAALRKRVPLGRVAAATLGVARVEDLGTAGDLLADAAAEGAGEIRAGLRLGPARGWSLEAGWTRSVSGALALERLDAEVRRATSGGTVFVLGAARYGADGADRPYGLRVTAAVRLPLGSEEVEDDEDAR